MQSYDFLHLFEDYNCKVQIGGDDQWSNMLSGVNLIRKIHQNGSFCVTCPLLLNAEGQKMGKTVKGALWLDASKTSPYDFYQYWRNIQDSEVYDVLRMLTFLPMDEVKRLSSLQNEEINEAKRIAAFEITKIIHGEEEAIKAEEAAKALFEGKGPLENMPTVKIDSTISILDAIILTGIAPSKGQARTLINQGGITLNDNKIDDVNYVLSDSDFTDNYAILKKGKKVFFKLEK